ncbi:hypothetical protein KM043_011817 [Ampulex compressa]|nr:hypothetical protein KM043_011817 [Ampulex compressa]
MSYGGTLTPEAWRYVAEHNIPIIDLRSDTLTKPTASMRKAMYEAEVGDDVYEEDPTVKKLEERAAQLLGKEAAIFLPSGTMGNLTAIMIHCDVRGSEAYCGDGSHVVLHEQGGAAQIAGVTVCPLPNRSDGTFDLAKLEEKFRTETIHEPISKLVIVENTINGKVVPLSWIDELVLLAKKNHLRLHMDGARLWNASVASKTPAKEIASRFDSVTFCLSKGLGAPVGSLLCGERTFVTKARRIRKVLGGAMRQVGVLAAAGLVALEEVLPRLEEDHVHARKIARAINDLDSDICSVDLETVQSNMVFVDVNPRFASSRVFMDRLKTVLDDDEDDKIIILCLALNNTTVRLVLHYDISYDQLNLAIRKISYVVKTWKH